MTSFRISYRFDHNIERLLFRLMGWQSNDNNYPRILGQHISQSTIFHRTACIPYHYIVRNDRWLGKIKIVYLISILLLYHDKSKSNIQKHILL